MDEELHFVLGQDVESKIVEMPHRYGKGRGSKEAADTARSCEQALRVAQRKA